MSNEIHSLKIGNSEYPIYSTGVKLGSATGSSFMVASASSGNVVLGASNAISGDSTALTINSASLLVGSRSNLIDFGGRATNVRVGNNAANVVVGDSATAVSIGGSATGINIGLNATNINMADNNTGELLANKVLIGADPAVVEADTSLKADWLSKQALQNFIVGANNVNIGKYASYIYIGDNASSTNIGSNATNVRLGTGATFVEIGHRATSVIVGEGVTNARVGGGATNVSIGRSATNINIAENDTEASLANKVLIGADPAVVDADASLKSDWLSKQALQNFVVGATNINLGKYATNVNLGQYASIVNLGQNTSTVWIGSSASTVGVGNNAVSVSFGTRATSVSFGNNATDVYLGASSRNVAIGNLATDINVGSNATSINLGLNAPTINIAGNSTGASLANKVLIGADPAVVDADTTLKNDWLSKQALQNFVVGAQRLNIGKYASYVWLGSNATTVYLGQNATNVWLGSNATNIYLGRGASNVYLGDNVTAVQVGSNATTVYLGNTSGESASNPRYVNIGHILSSSDSYAYTVIQLNNKVMPRVISNTTPYIDLGASTNVGSRFRTGYFANVNYSGTCTQNSDERLKNFGDNLKIDFDALAQIRKANYTWKDTESYGEGNKIGVSAQEVQKLYPEVVVEDPETKLLSVDYAKLSVVALAAIDELHKENVELKSRLDAIETMVKQINNQ